MSEEKATTQMKTSVEEMVMPFDRAFATATGAKNIFFSSINKDIPFGDQFSVRMGNATYLNQDRDAHFTMADIIRPNLGEEVRQSPSYWHEPTNFAGPLPIIMKQKGRARFIKNIPDTELNAAGTANPQLYRVMLALQSDEKPQMEQIIKDIVEPVFRRLSEKGRVVGTRPSPNNPGATEETVLVAEAELPMFLHSMENAFIQSLQFGYPLDQIENPVLKHYMVEMTGLLLRELKQDVIPGKVATFEMRIPEVEELKECAVCGNERQAQETLYKALHYLYETVTQGAISPRRRATPDALQHHYGKTRFDKMKAGLKEQVDQLTQELKGDRLTLCERKEALKQVIKNANLSSLERFDLGIALGRVPDAFSGENAQKAAEERMSTFAEELVKLLQEKGVSPDVIEANADLRSAKERLQEATPSVAR